MVEMVWPPPKPGGNNDASSDKPNGNDLDAQRRTEIQALMKDKSLDKEERKQKMEEVKKKYAALAAPGKDEPANSKRAVVWPPPSPKNVPSASGGDSSRKSPVVWPPPSPKNLPSASTTQSPATTSARRAPSTARNMMTSASLRLSSLERSAAPSPSNVTPATQRHASMTRGTSTGSRLDLDNSERSAAPLRPVYTPIRDFSRPESFNSAAEPPKRQNSFKFEVAEAPKWRHVNLAKKAEGWSSGVAGEHVNGLSSEAIVDQYEKPKEYEPEVVPEKEEREIGQLNLISNVEDEGPTELQSPTMKICNIDKSDRGDLPTGECKWKPRPYGGGQGDDLDNLEGGKKAAGDEDDAGDKDGDDDDEEKKRRRRWLLFCLLPLLCCLLLLAAILGALLAGKKSSGDGSNASGNGLDASYLNEIQTEWLNQHNLMRTKYHQEYGVSVHHMQWSHGLEKDAADIAKKLAEENNCSTGNVSSIYGKSEHGRIGSYPSPPSPKESVTSWMDTIDSGGNSATQVVWRATDWLGCASATTTECAMNVCLYAKPGNCNKGNFGSDWETPTYADDSPCGPESHIKDVGKPVNSPPSDGVPEAPPQEPPTLSSGPLFDSLNNPGPPDCEAIEYEMTGRIEGLDCNFCGSCEWKSSGYTCWQRIGWLAKDYGTPGIEGRKTLCEREQCLVPEPGPTPEDIEAAKAECYAEEEAAMAAAAAEEAAAEAALAKEEAANGDILKEGPAFDSLQNRAVPCREAIDYEMTNRVEGLDCNFCGFCQWKDTEHNCYQRVGWLRNFHSMDWIDARQSLCDYDQCLVPEGGIDEDIELMIKKESDHCPEAEDEGQEEATETVVESPPVQEEVPEVPEGTANEEEELSEVQEGTAAIEEEDSPLEESVTSPEEETPTEESDASLSQEDAPVVPEDTTEVVVDTKETQGIPGGQETMEDTTAETPKEDNDVSVSSSLVDTPDVPEEETTEEAMLDEAMPEQAMPEEAAVEEAMAIEETPEGQPDTTKCETPSSAGECFSVIVETKFDQFAQDTWWDVTNKCGDIVASSPKYDAGMTEDTQELCLPPGNYVFSISDEYQDGMCCAWGEGSYRVTTNANANGLDELIKAGAEFADKESTRFSLPFSPPLQESRSGNVFAGSGSEP